MHNWFSFALLAPAIYAITNFIDKYVVGGKVKDPRIIPILTTVMAAIFGSGFWIIAGRPVLENKDALIVLATGALSVYALYFYFRALVNNTTSNVIILFQMIPVLSLLGSVVFLHEPIHTKELLGFLLIVFSVLAVSIRKESGKFRLDSFFWNMLAADILWAASYVLIKFAINANSFAEIISYESWGIFIGGMTIFFFFPHIRKAFLGAVSSISKGTFAVLFLNEVLFVLAKSLTFLALSIGPVALVTVLGSVQVFYGIILGIMLTILYPFIFKEDISLKSILKKILLTFVLLSGISLIY